MTLSGCRIAAQIISAKKLGITEYTNQVINQLTSKGILFLMLRSGHI